MKIVHVILTGPYTVNMTYQENLLVEQNVKDGHDVTVIASCDVHKAQDIVQVQEENRWLDEGYRLIRLAYRYRFLSTFISRKLRAVKGLKALLKNIDPDIVFHHGLQSYALNDLVWFKKHHPSTKFYVDSHEDFHNSARTWFSKYLLHKGYYRPIIRRALKSIDRVFYVTYESVAFLSMMYGIEEKHMEFYPLGGKVLPEEERMGRRLKTRKALGYLEGDLVCIHSGKMNEEKRTLELLEAFISVKHAHLKLLIVGVFDQKIQETAISFIQNDSRITYVGWKDAEGLTNYLTASDLYVQPGSQSATMQNALCLGCAAAVYPYESHRYLLSDKVYYIQSKEDMKQLFTTLATSPKTLENAKKSAYHLALERLDYRILAHRLYKD